MCAGCLLRIACCVHACAELCAGFLLQSARCVCAAVCAHMRRLLAAVCMLCARVCAAVRRLFAAVCMLCAGFLCGLCSATSSVFFRPALLCQIVSAPLGRPEGGPGTYGGGLRQSRGPSPYQRNRSSFRKVSHLLLLLLLLLLFGEAHVSGA